MSSNGFMPAPMEGETLDLAEAARYLKIGYEAMKELYETGQVPAASFNQKHVVLLREDLRSYIREVARRQAAERRSGVKPSEHVAAPRRRPRHWRPDLDAAERGAAERADSNLALGEGESGTRRRR